LRSNTATRWPHSNRGLVGAGVVVGEQLRKLTTMHHSGDITDAEFAAAKKRLLGT